MTFDDTCTSSIESATSDFVEQCSCQCCSMTGPPTQPAAVALKESKQSCSHYCQSSSRKKSYNRSIQTSWYKKYPWITVCTKKYKIFCHICRLAQHKKLITFSKRQENKFIEKGFVTGRKHCRKWKSMIKVKCTKKQS